MSIKFKRGQLHSSDLERGQAEVEFAVKFDSLFSLLPKLIAQAHYDLVGINTLSIDPVTIIRALVVAELAHEKTIITTRDIPANDSVTVLNIVNSKNSPFIYLPWVESWDVETENVVTFDEFFDKDVVASSAATFSIDKLTTSDEAAREMFVSFLTKPIKHHIHIRFTNTSGSQVWAKHIWQGIRIKKKDYMKYIWKHLKKVLDAYSEVKDIVL